MQHNMPFIKPNKLCYQNFVTNFAKTTEPERVFNLSGHQHAKAFNCSQQKLVESPVPAYPEFNDFVLETDESICGLETINFFPASELFSSNFSS